MFCVRDSVDILLVKAKARVLRDLLVAAVEVNVGSSFSTLFLTLFFSCLLFFTFYDALRGWRKRWLHLCIVRLFTFNVLRTLPPIPQTLLLSIFCFYQFCQFALFTFSPLTTSSTLGTHTHTYPLL